MKDEHKCTLLVIVVVTLLAIYMTIMVRYYMQKTVETVEALLLEDPVEFEIIK